MGGAKMGRGENGFFLSAGRKWVGAKMGRAKVGGAKIGGAKIGRIYIYIYIVTVQ